MAPFAIVLRLSGRRSRATFIARGQEIAVDFAAGAYWAATKRKTKKSGRFISPSETNGFATLA